MTTPHLNDPKLDLQLQALLLPRAEEFRDAVPLQEQLFRSVQESKGVLGLWLAEAANPYLNSPPVRWTALAAREGGADLLRADFSAAGYKAELRQSRNLAVVLLPGLAAALAREAAPSASLHSLLAAVLRLKSHGHDWRFDLGQDALGTLRRGPVSNQGAPALIDLQSRHDRVDLLLHGDTLCIVLYNRPDQLEDFPPADRWFSPQARAALLAPR
jgi:hypothetical protein